MKVNYTIDLDEYETLCELQRLHCGPSLCLRRVSDGILINLVLLSNIAFSESSFQVFLEEIDRISKLPSHPCIVRFIGLSKPNPNYNNSIGIGYEFCPKCFSLAYIIEGISLKSQKSKVEDFSSTFGHNNFITQNTQSKKDNDDLNNDINNNNTTNNDDKNDNSIQQDNSKEVNFQLNKEISNTDDFKENDDVNNDTNIPNKIDSKNDFNNDCNNNESSFNNNNSIDNTSNLNNNAKDDADSNFDNSNSIIDNDNDLSFDNNNNSNDNDLNFDNNSNIRDINLHNSDNNNDSDLNFDNNNNSTDLGFDNNQNSNSTETNFDNIQNNNDSSELNFDNNHNNNDSDLNFDNNNDLDLSFDNNNKDSQSKDNNEKQKQMEKTGKKTKNTNKKEPENESLLSNEQTLILLYGISNAISFLHKHGIPFMNLNISNILLDENLEPKIQYYGISSLFEYFSICCCNLNGSNIFKNITNKSIMINNYIINYNSIIRSISSNDVIDLDGYRIVNNKCFHNVHNSNYSYIFRNLTDDYMNPDGQSNNEDKGKKPITFLDRNLKDLIFVSPEVLYGQIPDKRNDVYGFSYLIYFFCAQERIKWILNFDISYLNKITNGNRLIVKSSVPILVKLMITKSWDMTPDYRPDMSEIAWWISELGQFFFINEYHHNKIVKMEEFQRFKEKLPKIKKERNLFILKKNTKILYDTVKKLPISNYGQNYAQSVIRLQSLLMSLRNSNLYDTLESIVLNEPPKPNDHISLKRRRKHQRSKLKQPQQNNDSSTDTNDNNVKIYTDDSNHIFNFDSLSDSDYESKIFNQLYFVQTKDGVYSLALNIAVACKSRFKKILYYARLVSELYHGYRSKYPFLVKLKKYLLSFFLTSLANYCAYPNALPIVALVFYCLQFHVYEINEMIDTITTFYEDYKNEKKISISILFCWFCPEIESGSPGLFSKMYDLVKTQCQHDYFPFAFKKFIQQIDHYRENNWSFYYNHRFDKDVPDSFTHALRKDDLASFQTFFFGRGKKLLNSKIDPDIFVPCTYAHHYPTSLMYAALFGSVRCFFFLLRNGARTGSWDRKYRLLPSYSVAGGDESLFVHCVQCNKEDDSLMQTAAQFHRNYLFTKSFQIDKGLLTSMDKFGKSVLSAAAESNNAAVLIFSFVQKSCQENFVESFGRTPLHVAAEQEMIDVLRVLLFLANDEPNTNSNSNSNSNSLAASQSASSFNSFDADTTTSNVDMINSESEVKSSKKFKAKLTSKFKSKITSKFSGNKIHLSNSASPLNSNFDADNINENAVKIEAKKEEKIVDVNARDSWGMTPLHLAADKMKRRSVEILFTSPNIDVNIKNNSGKTAVYYAVKTGDLKLIKLFLKNPNVDFCCQTKKGETPLHTAVKMGRPDIVKLIIDNKPVSIYIPDTHNMSPFELAVANNTTEIADIFHDYIMKKYEENNASKQKQIVDANEMNTDTHEKTDDNNDDAIPNDKLNDENTENEKKDDATDENENKNQDVITDEIPFIDIVPNETNIDDESQDKKKKRRKKKKDNDEDCVVS